MQKFKGLLLLMLITQLVYAQDESMLKDVEDSTPVKQYVTNAFKSSRVINSHSMEFIGKGVLDFRILHRFGRINQGFEQLFGLDQASMRMGFDYGITKNFTAGIGRSTLNKELDGFIKFRPVWQAKGGSPVTVVLLAGMTFNSTKATGQATEKNFEERSAYYYEMIIGRKFNDRFSLQLNPILLHRNAVDVTDENDIYAIGIGGRFKITKRLALVADYSYVVNGLPQKLNQNPLSIGIDIETGGHVFQLHFSNTGGMNERAFITETTNKWAKGDIQFGFNLSRVFSIGRKRK
jgi:Membrane bound beta barrel domain (DUF5777)